MNLQSLNELFVHELRDLYSAEQQIVAALPKMANAATAADLRQAFNDHLQQTRNQVHRLDQIFNKIGKTHDGQKCEAMEGIIKEGEKVVQAHGDSAVKDAALIAAAQRVEHYEMAGYGAARTYAKELGYSEAADLLQQTLDEEGNTDKKLTKLAEGGLLSSGINEQARQA